MGERQRLQTGPFRRFLGRFRVKLLNMIVSVGDRQLVLAVEPFGGHSDSTVPNAPGVFVAPNVSLSRPVRFDAAVMSMLPSCREAAGKLQANRAELPLRIASTFMPTHSLPLQCRRNSMKTLQKSDKATSFY